MDGLLFVFRELGAERVDAERCGRCDGGGVFGGNEKFLADGGDRCAGDALGKAFVVDVGDVVDAEAAWASGGVGVFAAGLDVQNVAGVLGYCREFTAGALELFVIVGVGDPMEIAAVDGFGLVVLGDGDGFEALFPVAT